MDVLCGKTGGNFTTTAPAVVTLKTMLLVDRVQTTQLFITHDTAVRSHRRAPPATARRVPGGPAGTNNTTI